ncbi:Ni,Fe-hydrogenase I large subunit [Paramagnetospirillum kuznetsovii]|uniref:Ni,Fe-hydrogenase I large subunit n=1 Tax=Paramagnetospirillum kuznetsovii TaxID=2053833 RepID=A0A364NUA5_9PROT|nr:nickel-dependent hydrogenase large subunit [Paramagnetospirillum kuznetsovii]RAU20663.1 Ni,Fe-hydrogenase I large subunit [Paramagnetospirillum kuznetsovii]
MAFPDTGISVSLEVRQGQVAHVAMRSGRLVQASRLLAGRGPNQVIALLPTLFALCGTAQALAGAAALEQAAGLSATASQRMARRYLLLVECLSEHAQSILRDWPALLDETPRLEAVKPLRPMVGAAKRALYPDGDWARPGGGRLVVDHGAVLEQSRLLADLVARLFGDLDDWDDGLDDFRRWFAQGDCVAARLLRRIEAEGLGGFGATPVHFMSATGPRDLAERLEDDQSGDYVARPDHGGIALETTPLSRHHGHPLVNALMAEHGSGLLPRFAARLVDVAAALREVEELVQDLCDEPFIPGVMDGTGVGLGMVDAARGLLAHRVELQEGVVRRYQILAPTEWNFHPDGAFAQGIRGAAAGPDLVRRARLLAAALDPCVACTIEVHDHA